MPSRILVTGGAGFIGSQMRSATARHTVLIIDKLTYAGDLESLAPVAHNPGYSFVRADIVDAAKMRGVIESFESDAIMPLAAESHSS
jgi:dTDP-glucose 4,6-dehydratase